MIIQTFSRLLLAALLPLSLASSAVQFDVVVYGGTSAGVAAALQTARMGKTTVLIEPSQHIGGLTSGGLGMTDTGSTAVIGGISREFYQNIRAHYSDDAAWTTEKREDFPFFRAGEDALWRFEPKVAEKVYREMLAAAKVEIITGERLDLRGSAGVEKEHLTIRAIIMESGRKFTGQRFIDATYEGDLMAKAGVSYHVGRESNATYGETLNGIQTRNARHHQFASNVDPYIVPGDPASGLLPGIHGNGPGEEGAGDKRVQAYCFRMCMTDAPENRVPFPKPDDYDPLRYELFARYLKAGTDGRYIHPAEMPNRKTDTNNNGGFSTDNINMNYAYPEGDYATRERIIREHTSYQKGLMWFLCNDERVPEDLRREMSKWGLAKDEFVDNDNWPHQIYVREARRMVSDYVQTEHDCFRTRDTPESVGMGSYNMDSHHAQRYVSSEGYARNEGDVQVSPGGPYRISYRAIRPKASECTNLLVPAALSSSHIAYGSIRMEPVFMILGQSAATAACLSIDADVTVQAVNYPTLRDCLIADGQVLEYDAPPKKHPTGRGPEKLGGIVVDDVSATLTGNWTPSTSTGGYVSQHYLHDENTGKGEKTARFETKIGHTSNYEIRLYFPAHGNRATNVPVTIKHNAGTTELAINQKTTGADGYTILGTFTLTAGQSSSVTISTSDTDGYVIADAVQWVEAK
ncbi:MAG: FAD-dependent oxidoreductase [Verrucomicrobiae bacterium]|nr:FAD-dependent oxidoreductase [Verrucomicrobiae bacterium]